MDIIGDVLAGLERFKASAAPEPRRPMPRGIGIVRRILGMKPAEHEEEAKRLAAAGDTGGAEMHRRMAADKRKKR